MEEVSDISLSSQIGNQRIVVTGSFILCGFCPSTQKTITWIFSDKLADEFSFAYSINSPTKQVEVKRAKNNKA
jgi:hypothetical protein